MAKYLIPQSHINMPLQIPGWANKHKQPRQDTWWLGGVLIIVVMVIVFVLLIIFVLLMDFKECCYIITMCSMSLLPLLLWVWPDRAFDLFQLLASAVAERRKSYVLATFDQKSSHEPNVMNFEFSTGFKPKRWSDFSLVLFGKGREKHVSSLKNPCNNSDQSIIQFCRKTFINFDTRKHMNIWRLFNSEI